jgi:hypothetical protein
MIAESTLVEVQIVLEIDQIRDGPGHAPIRRRVGRMRIV